MYIWKCWYDTRKYFFVYLAVFLPLAPALVLVMANGTGQWAWGQPLTPEIGQRVSQVTLSLGFILGLFAGFSLAAAAGIGQEFKNGTLEHLLTRPRSRRYFIWTGWAVGVTELFVMFTLATLAASGYLFLAGGAVHTWKMLMLPPLLLIPAAVFYGLVYLLAILLRGHTHTGAAGAGILILYGLLGSALNYYWQIELPSLRVLFTWIIKDMRGEFPALALAGWTLVALAFPLAAQWAFERAEV